MNIKKYSKRKNFVHKDLVLGEFCYIRGYWKALVIKQCREFVQCVPLEFYKEMKWINKKAKKTDFIYTFVPSMIHSEANYRPVDER